MLALALAALLAAIPPLSPVVPLPAQLEVCLLAAEVCVLEAGYPDCPIPDAYEKCVSAYEDCSYACDDAHTANCRVDRVWCLLEHCVIPAEWGPFCAEADATCGDATTPWCGA